MPQLSTPRLSEANPKIGGSQKQSHSRVRAASKNTKRSQIMPADAGFSNLQPREIENGCGPDEGRNAKTNPLRAVSAVVLSAARRTSHGAAPRPKRKNKPTCDADGIPIRRLEIHKRTQTMLEIIGFLGLAFGFDAHAAASDSVSNRRKKRRLGPYGYWLTILKSVGLSSRGWIRRIVVRCFLFVPAAAPSTRTEQHFLVHRLPIPTILAIGCRPSSAL